MDPSPLSGSFRFRVLPSASGRKRFAKGTDLLLPDGRTWKLSLYNAVHTPGFAPLVLKLFHENLLDIDLHNSIAELPHINLKNTGGVLYTLSDPFTLSLDHTKMITINTEEQVAHFQFRPLIDPPLGRFPFTGILLSNYSRRI